MRSMQTPARGAPLRLFLVLGLLLACGARAAGWSVAVTPDDALYPALDLSQGQRTHNERPDAGVIGAGTGLVQVDRVAARDGERVTLAVRSRWLAQPAVLAATLPRAGERYRLRPVLDWNAAALSRLGKPEPADLDFEFAVDGAPPELRRVPVKLHPLDEALYFVRDGGVQVDLGWIFAAYADPQSRIVDDILALARERHPEVPLEPGRRSRQETLAAAYAIWEVLERHGLRYADENPGVARGPAVWSQRVRRHEDAWRERRANCLDGSLLIAAALERAGIGSALILVPGHALLAFNDAPGEAQPVFVETTLLGTRKLPPRPRPGFVRRLGGFDPEAMDSFDAALAAGRARYAREAHGFGRRDPDYQWIDLATARSYGIIPLVAGGSAAASPTPR